MIVTAKKILNQTNFSADLADIMDPKNYIELVNMQKRYRELLALINDDLAQLKKTGEPSYAYKIGKLIFEFKENYRQKGIEIRGLRNQMREDLKVSRSRLGYFMTFYKLYRQDSIDDSLSWGYYQELINISNAEIRNKIYNLIKQGKITSIDQIRSLKKELTQAKKRP